MSVKLNIRLKALFVSFLVLSLLGACGKKNDKKRLTLNDRVDFVNKPKPKDGAAAETPVTEKPGTEKPTAEKPAGSAGAKTPDVTPQPATGDTKTEAKPTDKRPETKPEPRQATKEEENLRNEIVKSLGDEGPSLLVKLTAGKDLVSKIGAIALDLIELGEVSGKPTFQFDLTLYAKNNNSSKESPYPYLDLSYQFFGDKTITENELNLGLELKPLAYNGNDAKTASYKKNSLSYFDSVFTSAHVKKIDINGLGAHFVLTLENKSGMALAYVFRHSKNKSLSTLELVQILGQESFSSDILEKLAKYSKEYAPQLVKMETAILPLYLARNNIGTIAESDKALAELIKEDLIGIHKLTEDQVVEYKKLVNILMLSTVEGSIHPGINKWLKTSIDGLTYSLEAINNKILPSLESKASKVAETSKGNFGSIKALLEKLNGEIKFEGMYEAQKVLTGVAK